VSESRAPDASSYPSTDGSALAAAYGAVRDQTLRLCEPLATEDYVLQCMAESSPTRWHIAHVTWFFERFILQEHVSGYEPYDARYYFLFNSYYQALGPRHGRAQRGDLSRPTVDEIRAYRQVVDERMVTLLGTADDTVLGRVAPLLTLGLNHEQQHQELLLTDLKVNLSQNPLHPVYRPLPEPVATPPAEATWIEFDGGIRSIGTGPEDGFHYDNEGPRHEVLLRPYALASRPVSNAEYLAFVEDGGYEHPSYWLDLGYSRVRSEGWNHPLYWERVDDTWHEYTLGGLRALAPAEPVCHLSYFEADAFARWAEHRLPTEAEWECAAAGLPLTGHFADAEHAQPMAAPAAAGLQQMFGTVWEWTSSAYSAYPGYRPPPGAVGEYNGKFMCNQYVLRGGSHGTPAGHIRASYRNFFPPESRWQFAGLRLARDL